MAADVRGAVDGERVGRPRRGVLMRAVGDALRYLRLQNRAPYP